jgi:predicted nucleotide-binding protein
MLNRTQNEYMRAQFHRKCEVIYERLTPWLNRVLGIPVNPETLSVRFNDFVLWFEQIADALVESYLATYKHYGLPFEQEDAEHVLYEVVRVTNKHWEDCTAKAPGLWNNYDFMMQVGNRIVQRAQRELFIAQEESSANLIETGVRTLLPGANMDTATLKQRLAELLSQADQFNSRDFPKTQQGSLEFFDDPPAEWVMWVKRVNNIIASHFQNDSGVAATIERGVKSANALRGNFPDVFVSAITNLKKGLEQGIKVIEDDKYNELVNVSSTASPVLEMTSRPAPDKIFIGHGRSSDWKDLKDFIQDRLKLQWDEFNRETAAGKSVKERLEEMLNSSGFALLVMTAEDEHADETLHARENVIHEVGLFQGKLGFNKAIILLENDCKEFSNIIGIGQIRYPKGHIRATFEEVRQVLEREKVLSK